MKMDCEKQRDLQKLSLIVSKCDFEEGEQIRFTQHLIFQFDCVTHLEHIRNQKMAHQTVHAQPVLTQYLCQNLSHSDFYRQFYLCGVPCACATSLHTLQCSFVLISLMFVTVTRVVRL